MSRFTSIAVDPQVGTTEGKTYDVIFVGTTKGRVIKTINAQSADSREGVKTVVIEELQVSSCQFLVCASPALWADLVNKGLREVKP